MSVKIIPIVTNNKFYYNVKWLQTYQYTTKKTKYNSSPYWCHLGVSCFLCPVSWVSLHLSCSFSWISPCLLCPSSWVSLHLCPFSWVSLHLLCPLSQVSPCLLCPVSWVCPCLPCSILWGGPFLALL